MNIWRALPARSRRFYLWLGLLTLVALAIRLVYAYHSKWDQAINGDAFYYHYQANGLIHGNGFQLYHQRANGAVVPVGSADNRPLYVLYLAAYSLVGLSSFHAHMIATCLLGAAGVAATGLLGRELVGERTGLIAAGIACVYANYWVYDPLVTSESLTIFLVALMLLFAVRFWKAPSFGRGAVLGVIVALGALTRSELLLFLPIVVIPVLWRLRADWRRRIAIVVVSGLAALLILSPWMIRGLTAFHRPIPLSGGFGVAIASANCHDTYYGDLLGWWSARCNGPLPKGDASDRDFVLRKKGFDYIDNHLGRFPVVALARVGRMWEVFRPGWFWGKANISQTVLLDVIEGRTLTAARIALAQFYLLVPFAVGGLVVLHRRRQTILPFLALPVITTITAITTFGNPRYRTPAEVVIVSAAAVAFDALLTSYQARRAARPVEPDLPVTADTVGAARP